MNNRTVREINHDVLFRLIQSAFAAREFSYSPYSGFAVGAALLAESGEIYTGCNVENSSYPVGSCAERTALTKAVSEGETCFAAMAIVGGSEPANTWTLAEYCVPCGMCRQLLSEFCDSDFLVILARSLTDYKLMTLGELLPKSFSLK